MCRNACPIVCPSHRAGCPIFVSGRSSGWEHQERPDLGRGEEQAREDARGIWKPGQRCLVDMPMTAVERGDLDAVASANMLCFLRATSHGWTAFAAERTAAVLLQCSGHWFAPAVPRTWPRRLRWAPRCTPLPRSATPRAAPPSRRRRQPILFAALCLEHSVPTYGNMLQHGTTCSNTVALCVRHGLKSSSSRYKHIARTREDLRKLLQEGQPIKAAIDYGVEWQQDMATKKELTVAQAVEFQKQAAQVYSEVLDTARAVKAPRAPT